MGPLGRIWKRSTNNCQARVVTLSRVVPPCRVPVGCLIRPPSSLFERIASPACGLPCPYTLFLSMPPCLLVDGKEKNSRQQLLCLQALSKRSMSHRRKRAEDKMPKTRCAIALNSTLMRLCSSACVAHFAA